MLNLKPYPQPIFYSLITLQFNSVAFYFLILKYPLNFMTILRLFALPLLMSLVHWTSFFYKILCHLLTRDLRTDQNSKTDENTIKRAPSAYRMFCVGRWCRFICFGVISFTLHLTEEWEAIGWFIAFRSNYGAQDSEFGTEDCCNLGEFICVTLCWVMKYGLYEIHVYEVDVSDFLFDFLVYLKMEPKING